MKITFKDYIGYFIGLLGCIVGIIGLFKASVITIENKQLKSNAQYIHNSAQTIRQYFYNTNYNFPDKVKSEVENIARATANVVNNKVFNKE
ncbi:MAG: hypothetical protein NTX01_01325 [Candidatus Omnitrophica bacterium]|nr:hypothetical protein [Candidatus Omnitrophota bacterium]